MNNAAPPFISVPQELFGGLYTEATPESLPQGASPLCVNCDFIIGEVDPRPGKQSVYYYDGIFIERITNHATSVDDGVFLNEVPWSNPSRAQNDVMGSYAEVNLVSRTAPAPVDQVEYISQTMVQSTASIGPLTPSQQGEFALMSFGATANTFAPSDPVNMHLLGGTLGGRVYSAMNNVPETFGVIMDVASASTAALVLMYTLDGNLPTIQNSNYVDVPFAAPTGSLVAPFPNPTTQGNSLFVVLNVVGQTGATKALSDTQLNGFNLLAVVVGPSHATYIWGAFNIVGGFDTITLTDTGNFGASGDMFCFEMPQLSNAVNTAAESQLLECINFNFSIPTTQTVLGMQVEITGKQNQTNAEAVLTATFNQAGSKTLSGQLGLAYGTLVLGSQTEDWDLVLTPNLLNDPSFGVNIQAFSGPPIPVSGGGSGDVFDRAFTSSGNSTVTIANSGSPTQNNEFVFGSLQQSSAFAADVPNQADVQNFSISGNVLTMSSSLPTPPPNCGPGSTVTLSGFSGPDTFMNGLTVVVSTFASNVITAPLVHANYTGSGGGWIGSQGWSPINPTPAATDVFQNLPTTATVTYNATVPNPVSWCFGMAFFGVKSGQQGSIRGSHAMVSGAFSSVSNASVGTPPLAGSTCFFRLRSGNRIGSPVLSNLIDDVGNTWKQIYQIAQGDTALILYYAENVVPMNNMSWTAGGGLYASADATFYEAQNLAGLNTTVPYTFDISAVKIKAWLTPNPPPSFNYLKTFAETAGEILNLVLGDDGVMYQEDAVNNPGVLSAVNENILPSSFAQSCTLDNREFIAISNLTNGTDNPLTYTPPYFDRLSQVGPGTGPAVSTSNTNQPIDVVSITQNPKVEIRRIAWGASANAINDSTAGNILVIFGEGRTTPLSNSLPYAVEGGTIVLSGLPALFPKKGGGNIPYNLNGTYTILQVTTAIVGGSETCPCFTVQAPATAYGYSNDFGSGGTPTSGWYYQATLATLTTNTQIPGLEVGGTLELTGTGGAPPGGYDGSWTVISSPNATTMEITSTVLNGNVATYSYIVVGLGPNPVVGELVTVTGTTNGNGIFNVANQAITATSPGTFSVGITSPNIPAAGEPSASAQIFGTTFTFEPGVLVGTRTTGTVVQQGQITSGTRKVCYSFLTRNGYLTRPSPITTAIIQEGAGSLVISGLAIGPSNVIARVIHLTPTNGGNFYNIPQDVTVLSNGQKIVNTSTWVNDNTSTSVTLSFSDGVLLASDQIDIEGNNLFALEELGACTALIPYSNRLIAVGEQNKVQNLLNYSFDGGYGGNPGSRYPLGWQQDPTFGAGGNVALSPIFGFNYQIINASGSTQATYGMITQNAYQDEFLTPIINASTTYSVRATVSVPTGAAGGNLVIDLYSPSAARALGTFTLPLASVGTTDQIYTGTLLTSTLAPVPKDLIIRLYATSIANGVTVNVDRIEVFPTEAPNNSQQVICSYNGNFESFDLITGVILGTNVNQQPILSAFVLFDSLYLVKSGSLINTSDNNTTEPNNWNTPRTVSAAVGTTGPYAVTTGIDEPNSGEEYAIIAGRPGAFLYAGGQPIKITEEIQKAWNSIYWESGQTIWIKNDITNRRVYFGVPMATKIMVNNKLVQNPWLPAGVVADNLTPSTPNVILMCNYKQINTASELGGSPEVHRSYSGKLIASEITRKWSIWSVKAPCAAFITRNDKTAPLFLGNSDHTGKVYQFIDGLLQDDGAAFTQDYITSAFVSTETGQNTQMGNVRYNYDYMTLLLKGIGDLAITALPNTIDTPYPSQLLPDLTLPDATNGDIELPLNECASRLFLRFTSDQLDAGFYLSRAEVMMHQDPWSPVRGVNN